MSRYIDADVARARLMTLAEEASTEGTDFLYYRDVIEAFDDVETVDVAPVIHAHWEKECKSQITFPDGEVAVLVERKCSNCKKWSDKEIVSYYKEPAKYCCECNAKMDEEVNNKGIN